MAMAASHREEEESCTKRMEDDCQNNQCLQCVCQLNDQIEDFFQVLGRTVGKYPIWSLLMVLLVLFGLSFGLIAFDTETDVFNLWTPTNSPTFDERKFLDEYWSDLDYGNVLIAVTDKDDMDADILDISYVQEWHSFLMHIYAETPRVNWTYMHHNETTNENTTKSALWAYFPGLCMIQYLWKEPESLDVLSERGSNGEQQDGYASEVVPFCRPFATSPLESQFQFPCYILTIFDCFAEGGFIYPYEEYLAKTFLADIFPDNRYKYLPSFQGMSSVELGSQLGPSCYAFTGTLIPDNFIYGGTTRVDSSDRTSALSEVKGFQAIMFSESGLGVDRKRKMLRGECHKTSLYSIECAESTDEDLRSAEKFLNRYFSKLIDYLIDFIDEWEDDDNHRLTAGFWTPRTSSDLLKDAASADFLLLGVAYAAMILFAGLSFLKPNDMFLSRSEASSCGVLIVLCSVIATFGVASLAVKFSPNVVQVLPFIALGFGVDDMFVILSAFYFNDSLPPEEMTAEALKVAGSSVALTSMANFMAFLIASFMPLPDVARFATVGMVVVALNWFAVVFGFTAVVALTAGRMKKGYKDWGCCVCYQLDCTKLEKKESIHSEKPPHEDESMFDPLFDWLSQDTIRLCSIFGFLALAAVGAYGASLAKVGLPLADIMPEDTYARHYLTIKEEYFHSITNLWFSDGKGKNLRRIDWANKFGEWVGELDQIWDMSDKIYEDPGQSRFWAWNMRDYFVDGYATFFGDDGYSLETVESAEETLNGRSSDCEADRESFCPSLTANYTYDSELYNCLDYNADDLSSEECVAWLAEEAPATPTPGIANQIGILNARDDSVNGVYYAPSADTSLVYYRDDGAVIYRREDYTWVVLDNQLTPLYYSMDTDTSGTEPPQQAWYRYSDDRRFPMTVIVYDLVVYSLGIRRDDDFLEGDIEARSTIEVKFDFLVNDENEKTCFAQEIAESLMKSQSAYTSVTLSSDAGGSETCDAVLEASDVCYGFAAGVNHGSMECGAVEQNGDITNRWWQGTCDSGDSVIAVNRDYNISKEQACACVDGSDDNSIMLPNNTHYFSPCSGADFGGFGIIEESQCSAESQSITLSCEVLSDCTNLDACLEFVQESEDLSAECNDNAISRYKRRTDRPRILGPCLLSLYSRADSCCQAAIEASLVPSYDDCDDIVDDIDAGYDGIDRSDRLAFICDLTDDCSSTCSEICYDSMLADCFVEISENCQSEFNNGSNAEFKTCMDSVSKSDCCSTSYSNEVSTYEECMIPVDSYWSFSNDVYNYSLCSDSDISDADCGTSNDQTDEQFDCLVNNQTLLSDGCCKRMIEFSTPQYSFTRDCQGDVVHFCADVDTPAEIDASCTDTLQSRKNSGELSENCDLAVSYCGADSGYPRTEEGGTATIDCASGYSGTRSRQCLTSEDSVVPQWQTADESGCSLLRCPDETLNEQLWEGVPVFNIRQYIGSDLSRNYQPSDGCEFLSERSALRRCYFAENGSAVWEDPVQQCRGWYTQWGSTLTENQRCDDDKPQSVLFAQDFDYSNNQTAEDWVDLCQSRCNNLYDHCWGFEILYDGEINDDSGGWENAVSCIAYDYCHFTTDDGSGEYNYAWQANTFTLMEYNADDCARANSGEVYPSTAWNAAGIPNPLCWNRTLWQFMVDPTGGVLLRDAFLVNDNAKLYGVSGASTLELISSSNSLTLRDIVDDVDAVEYLVDMRKYLNKNFVDNEMYVVPAGLVVSLYTQYIGVADYMAENLGYVSITIVITGVVFLLHPVAVFLVLLCDFAMLLEIYGFADWIGLRINGVLALNIVIAVGLTMEFTAHMARAFMLAVALPGEKIGIPGATEAQIRLKKTYREMFTPVTLGAITTILGVAPISAATFPYFRAYYFSLYVFIVLFGWVNGVIFLPIMLSLANPHPWAQNEERRTMASMSHGMSNAEETEMVPMNDEKAQNNYDKSKMEPMNTQPDNTTGEKGEN